MSDDAKSEAPAAETVGSAVIPMMNKLQDIFAQLGGDSKIDLPQVAVVGSQSSGKSSVLEALVGRDFLPRGPDICTRCPLLLQLVHTTDRGGDPRGDEWGEFLHLPNKKFFDFAEIRREIQAETDKEAGEKKGISDKKIRLKIHSPNVLDITLIDLPGITKVPVGDQPSDIEARIRTMILSYIKRDTCVILAVSPANSDLANSDALQLARIADPNGSRTIGVITKLDIMDRGTDARNFLLGNIIPLRLGYIGVVNRSQEDIIYNRTIKDALANEESFFRNKPVYHGLSDRCGIPRLAKKLNQILVQHIRTVLPALKARINADLVTVAKEYATYGEIKESKAEQGALLLNILTKYAEAFSAMVEGKSEAMSTSELYGGARIHYIFQSIFVKCLEEVVPCDDLTDEDIRTAIRNATGLKSSLFVPEVPFEILVRRQIERLLDPSIQCARFIYDELIKISHRCLKYELQRFPVLRKKIDEVIGGFLRKNLSPCEEMIENLIAMEMDYVNYSHPNFIGASLAQEKASQEVKTSRSAAARLKEDVESEKVLGSEKTAKSRSIIPRPILNGASSDQGLRPLNDTERIAASGGTSSIWGISSIFGRSDMTKSSTRKPDVIPDNSLEHSLSMIRLREPPPILKPTESQTEQEAIQIALTKVLLGSYYDIVRKNIEDSVPKAIMHFLVNHAKRELHNKFIKKLYRDNLIEEMLQEPEEISVRRKRARDTLLVLQQAFRTIDELPLDAEAVAKGYSVGSIYGASDYSASSKQLRSRKSGEQPPALHANSNGGNPYSKFR